MNAVGIRLRLEREVDGLAENVARLVAELRADNRSLRSDAAELRAQLRAAQRARHPRDNSADGGARGAGDVHGDLHARLAEAYRERDAARSDAAALRVRAERAEAELLRMQRSVGSLPERVMLSNAEHAHYEAQLDALRAQVRRVGAETEHARAESLSLRAQLAAIAPQPISPAVSLPAWAQPWSGGSAEHATKGGLRVDRRAGRGEEEATRWIEGAGERDKLEPHHDDDEYGDADGQRASTASGTVGTIGLGVTGRGRASAESTHGSPASAIDSAPGTP